MADHVSASPAVEPAPQRQVPTFWLGTDMPGWLGQYSEPMMVSRRRLSRYKNLPRAKGRWVLDSGGFTELSIHGGWTLSAGRYAAEARRFHDEVGNLEWAASQDWMCEPWIIAKTGLTVEEHQKRTVDNYIELTTWAPGFPFIPTLQGWEFGDYMRHVEMYDRAGVDLRTRPVVGLGSVCRRQATDEIGEIAGALCNLGLKLHGFGCKAAAIKKYGPMLTSADSMAWSFGGRYRKPCPVRGVASCAHCWHWAMEWRDKVVGASRG